MLTRHDLDELARTTEDLLVSIYLPTHRRGTETQGDPIRLKNGLNEALALATAAGVEKKRIQALLAPAQRLLLDPFYWQHQADGLALFFSAGGMREHRLLHAVEDLVLVGNRFCLRPILPAVTAGDRFFVLALSQNRVRLIQCSRTSASEMELGDIPQSLTAVVGEDWKPATLQFHSGAQKGGRGRRQGAMFHGQGAGVDDAKPELERFLRLVDEGVTRRIGRNGVPLVVAAVRYEAAAFRQISHYPSLMAGELEGNPDRLDARELHGRAWPLVASTLDGNRQRAVAGMHAALHSGKVITAVDRVLGELHNGRVGTLLVRDAGPLWGNFDPATGQASWHGDRRPGDDELLDLAVVQALRAGTPMHAVPAAQLPEGAPMVATLRF